MDQQGSLTPEQLGIMDVGGQNPPWLMPDTPNYGPAPTATTPTMGQPITPETQAAAQQKVQAARQQANAAQDRTIVQDTGPPLQEATAPADMPAVPPKKPTPPAYQVGQIIQHDGTNLVVTGLDANGQPTVRVATAEDLKKPTDLRPKEPLSRDAAAENSMGGVFQHVAAGESGGKQFVLYGGDTYDPRTQKTLPGYYGFPDWSGKIGPDGRPTHAAGPVQWEPNTWKQAVEEMASKGLIDPKTVNFNNMADQQKVFAYWAQKTYTENGGGDLAKDFANGTVDYSKLGSQWTSMGGQFTAGSLPSYQDWKKSREEEKAVLKGRIADLEAELNKADPESKKSRELLDQINQMRLQTLKTEQDEIAHPPHYTPRDMMQNFGSVATLIGIFFGARSGAPLTASLGAAGDAMQAMNQQNYEQYKLAYDTWKDQVTMTNQLASSENAAYTSILDDRRLSDAEKVQRLAEKAAVWDNKMALAQLDAGDFTGFYDLVDKQRKSQAELYKAQKELEEAHAKSEKAREAQELDDAQKAAVAADDRQWKTDHPKATPDEIAQAHYDHVTQRKKEGVTSRSASRPDDYLGGAAERGAIMTQLGKMAADEAAHPKPGQKPRTLEELERDPNAVAEARKQVEIDKAAERQGAVIGDDEARMVAAQWLQGDPSGLTRLNQASRVKIQHMALQEVMPSLMMQYQKENGHPPSEEERQALINRVGGALATARANFQGFTQFQRTLATRQAQIDVAINEALQTIPRALAASDKVDRSQFRDLNAILEGGAARTGGEDVIQFQQYTQALLNEYARAIAPTGQITDQVRTQAQHQLSIAYANGQYRAAVEAMQYEMEIAQSSPEQVMQRRQAFFTNNPAWQTNFMINGVSGKGDPNAGFGFGGGGHGGNTLTATGPDGKIYSTDGGHTWFHADSNAPVQ